MCTRHLVEKQGTEAGGSISYSLHLAILQLNCQLTSQLHRQLERKRKRIKDRFTAMDLSNVILPQNRPGDIKEKCDEMPPNESNEIGIQGIT